MLRVEGAVVRFDDTTVLDGVSLELGKAETVAVLGPSGCGKSTLLRAVAGLESLAGGRVTWNGRDLAGVPPHVRGFGLMFQDYALFPHRDVRGNVEFGLRMARVAPEVRRRRVDDVLALVGLTGLASRRVMNLSGGEQQRVALARTLAPTPYLLMLDEPLGSLDRALHDRLLDELRDLLAAAALPTLYVTHDHDEAFALADRVVVMRDGRVAQAGTPRDVWSHPADEWTAAFLGFPPAVDAEVWCDGGEAVAATPWGRLRLGEAMRSVPGPARVVLRPGALRIDAGGALDAKVEQVAFRGDRTVARVRVGDGTAIEVTVDPRAGAGEAEPSPGDRVTVSVDPAGVLVYPPP